MSDLEKLEKKRLSVAYWGPIAPAKNERASGNGIFHETMINFLHTCGEVDAKVVALKSFGRRIGIFTVFLAMAKLWLDAWGVLSERADILIFAYPGIPIVPLTSNLKFPLAILLYGLLWLKKKITGQTVIFLVVDLPIEQSLNFNLPIRASIRLFNAFEGFAFRAADRIVCYSPLFIDTVCQKHNLPRGKCLLSRRFPYLPAYTHGGTIDPSIIKGRTKIFYAGELRRPVDIHNLKEALNAVKDVPEAFVYVCGMGGQWLTQLQQKNVVYLGVLDYRDFDTVAGMCDFGLIIYPRGPYYDITPTGKYSAYVANGLAVLSANPPAVAACIEEDGVGVSVPIDMIPSVLRKWVDDPAEFSAYRQAAARVSADFHSGLHLREWFNEVKHIARSKA